MRFAFTDEQLLFRDAVAELLAKECPPEAVRACWTNEDGRLPDVWRAFGDMGVLGLCVPEAHGGLGMDELDLVLLLEEMGRAALAEPIVETVAVAAPLLAESGPADLQEGWLPRIASGDAVVTVALAGAPYVPNVDTADLLIVQRDDRVAAVPTAAVTAVRQESVDGARRLFTVDWHEADEVVLASGAAGWQAANLAFDRGALATSAQLVGLADQLLATTVEYVKEREQFGVPIGSFQAIKHHLADVLLAVEFARPVVYRAAATVAHGGEHRSRDVSMAACYAADAATLAARTSLQCHGAIGYTVEHDLHLWMKRVWALAMAWGDADWHRRRVADVVLGPPS